MRKTHDTDLALLYHTGSENLRARTVETNLESDELPARRRTYPGAPRTSLGGREFHLGVDLGDALERRRSVRHFSGAAMSVEALGRLLFASYGCSARGRHDGVGGHRRPAPSAGGLYPVEIYAVLANVSGVSDGVYHYDAVEHAIELLREGRQNEGMIDLTMGQSMVRDANAIFVLTAARERTMFKYGQRGYRYLYLDAGHVGQNLYLVATALGLGPVGIGGFLDREVAGMCCLPEGEDALYVIAVGLPACDGRAK
jgi:SagB-type dehydrogenase family enzyme